MAIYDAIEKTVFIRLLQHGRPVTDTIRLTHIGSGKHIYRADKNIDYYDNSHLVYIPAEILEEIPANMPLTADEIIRLETAALTKRDLIETCIGSASLAGELLNRAGSTLPDPDDIVNKTSDESLTALFGFTRGEYFARKELFDYLYITEDKVSDITKIIDSYLEQYGRDRWKTLKGLINDMINERINVEREFESRYVIRERLMYVREHPHRLVTGTTSPTEPIVETDTPRAI